MTSPFDAIGPEQEQDAIGHISSMLVGTTALRSEPGVVYALALQKAHPADAGAIDQFLQGLDVTKQVRLAAATGTKITLSADQKTRLKALGMDYSNVEYTQADAEKTVADNISEQSGGKLKAKQNPDGTYVTDGKGNLVSESTEEPAHKYKAKGIGRLFQTLHNDILQPIGRDILKPGLSAAGKGLNYVDTKISDTIHSFGDSVAESGENMAAGQAGVRSTVGNSGASVSGPTIEPLINPEITSVSAARAADMTAQGYDPNNVWSQLAFESSGKAHSDLSGLATKWDGDNPSGLFGWNGTQAVNEAEKFMNNPEAYRKAIETSGTPEEAAAKLAAISSPQFQALTKEVHARSATVGNDVANAIGIDPVKHSTAYALTSAGTNLAVSFAIDPLMIAGSAAKAAKIARIGIDSLGDTNKAVKVLDPALGTNEVQRGWQRGIDLAHQIKDADAAGDKVQVAALTAKFNAELPALEPILPDFLGTKMLRAPEHWIERDGKLEPTFEQGEGINDLGQAADYVSSRYALTRLMNGRAATQASLMPGALSAFGYRKLKGAVAGWMTARSGTRAEKAYAEVKSAIDADPAVARKLFTEKDLVRLQAEADDATSAISDQVLAAKAVENGELSPAVKGQVTRNLRLTGSPLGGSKAGWASPTAVAARARIQAQRFATMLPRNTMIGIDDPTASDKIYKMALTYLNRGDANALKAAWVMGDGGQRKAIIGGLVDQLGHAAGLGKTETGQKILDSAKTQIEDYSSVGDNVVLDGQSLALHAGQVRTTWILPTYQQLQHASAKIGLWEATMGRAMTSSQADMLMSQWKMGALFKPSTVTRNQLEGWANTAMQGHFGDAVKAKAVLMSSNRELWQKGLAAETKAEYDALIAGGKTAEAETLAKSNMLDTQTLGRSTLVHRLAEFAPIALVGRAYHALVGKTMDAERVAALLTLGKDDLAQVMHEAGQQMREGALGTRRAASQSNEITKAGFGPAKIRYALNAASRKGDKTADEKVSWTQQDVDGTVGADRYENALAQRVNTTPSVAKAVIDHLEDPAKFPLSHVINALDDPAIADKMRLTGYGRVTWDDPTGPARLANNEDEKLLGSIEWANKVVNDYRHLLSGQDRVLNSKLMNEIKTTGRAPDAAWISKNLKNAERPEGVLAPEMTAVPNGRMRSGMQVLQDLQGGAYEWLVERPLIRTTSAPVFGAMYADARVGLNSMVKTMVETHGFSEAAAGNLAKELAIRNAWVKTEQLTDDPGLKTQFDVIARNMFPFSRATQAMIRRWGTGLWQDPTRARKMMLAYEGGVQSGFIYDNAYGEPTFTYPGSGVLNQVMREVAKIPGFESMNRFPVASSMTGGVLMAVPGADNPFRMSMGPMLSIPMREIFNLMPDHRAALDEVDAFINGPIGVGETSSQLVPAMARKFFTAMNDDERNSALASATVGAIANLASGGHVPNADASPAERDAFIQNVKAQTRNQLFVRALFGLIAPAAPSAPSEGTASSQADYAFHVSGVGQLSDEYKSILNDVDGDLARANSIFTALHPDQLVYTAKGAISGKSKLFSSYEIAKTQATSSHVYLPATAAALNWMEKNGDFITHYKSVAAYFLPESTGNEPFNDRAYNTQIELNLRQRKTASEFYTNLRVRNAEGVYYPMVEGFDERIAKAKVAGQTDQANQWTAAKSAFEADFKAKNPLFQQKIDSYPDARSTAIGQMADLHKMLASGHVPNGQAPLLRQLVAEYDNYAAFVQQHKGADAQSTAIRSGALQVFNQWAQDHIEGTPLADLYSGVYRTMNTNLIDLSPTH